jgi:hypothetical protein
MMGATNPKDAAPGTIRGDLASTIDHNVAHGSDAPATAEREIGIFFEPELPNCSTEPARTPPAAQVPSAPERHPRGEHHAPAVPEHPRPQGLVHRRPQRPALDLQRSGVDVIAMTAGEPDFLPPAHVLRAAHEAIDRGLTKYTARPRAPATCARRSSPSTRRENGLALRRRPGRRVDRRQAGPLQRLHGDPRPGRRGHRARPLLGELPRPDRAGARRHGGRGRRAPTTASSPIRTRSPGRSRHGPRRSS